MLEILYFSALITVEGRGEGERQREECASTYEPASVFLSSSSQN